MVAKLKYLLLQVRIPNDPMRAQEVMCFSRALESAPDNITTFDLLSGAPSRQELGAVDVVLIGGSGDYSVVTGGPWLEAALDAMRELHDSSKPTFASCWGFQAMALAMGGEVVTDMDRAELGTHSLWLTPEGQEDPIFGPLGATFLGQMGHQDIVDRLPDDATLLASTDLVANQAFRFNDKPIYCTQFHPELNLTDMVGRLARYPAYIKNILGVSFDEFAQDLTDTPATEALLSRFIRQYFG